jgi:hypothetical protein
VAKELLAESGRAELLARDEVAEELRLEFFLLVSRARLQILVRLLVFFLVLDRLFLSGFGGLRLRWFVGRRCPAMPVALPAPPWTPRPGIRAEAVAPSKSVPSVSFAPKRPQRPGSGEGGSFASVAAACSSDVIEMN